MSAELGFQFPIVSGIPDSLSCISDSKAQDSRFHKQLFSGFPCMGRKKKISNILWSLHLICDQDSLALSSLSCTLFLHPADCTCNARVCCRREGRSTAYTPAHTTKACTALIHRRHNHSNLAGLHLYMTVNNWIRIDPGGILYILVGDIRLCILCYHCCRKCNGRFRYHFEAHRSAGTVHHTIRSCTFYFRLPHSHNAHCHHRRGGHRISRSFR